MYKRERISMKTLLKIEHLQKSYGELQVLKDISLEVKEGEVVAILGPSGSGKSTLLRCATMLEKMDSGSLDYDGIEVCKSVNGKAIYAGKKTLK
jgi:polar amino acid transport system ATP-binding protein